MLKKSRQKKYFKKRWELISSHLPGYCIAPNDEEILHQLRVEIKKIRALIKFIPGRHKVTKELEPVKIIFKHAGNIRNAGMNLQLSDQYHLENEQFRRAQESLMNIEKVEFCRNQDYYIARLKKIKKQLLANFKSISNRKLIRLFNKQLKKIAGSLAGTGDRLHEARKGIKVLLYTSAVLSRNLEKKIHLNLSYLQELQELIGKWHDITVAATVLQKNDSLQPHGLEEQEGKLYISIKELSANFLKRAANKK